MPQSEEAQWWFDAVYRAVQTIPTGSCTTYGHIALLLDHPQRARQVGVCLKHLPTFDAQDPDKHFFHSDNVPWQRVVNAKGGISSRGDGGLAVNRQVEALRAEGVEVNDARGVEENFVDLKTFGWFPKSLPGEETESEQPEEEVNEH
jgi:methylated-DNA-protein-cysteine methyltransferase-like protein